VKQGASGYTMPVDSERTSLTPTTVDYVASAVKAALGTIPFAGSLFAELAGVVIPNQRIDRITKFAGELEARLGSLEQNFVGTQLKDEGFSDLLEEGLRQAARSLSDERRQYIATLITNSLSSDDIEYQESKHLLRILGELNDVEIIWLRFYREPIMGGDQEFRTRHKDVIKPVSATLGASQDILDKAALGKSYKDHLVQLGLLEPEYRLDMKTKQPEFDNFTGAQKIRNYRLTSIGRLLLREIGLGKGNAL